mgnify:CR=1 FL=1
MDMDIINIISTVGFPITCVIALGWFIRNVYDTMVTTTTNREEKLYKVIADAQAHNEVLTETNAEFAAVLRAYKADLEIIRNDVSEIKEHFREERNK